MGCENSGRLILTHHYPLDKSVNMLYKNRGLNWNRFHSNRDYCECDEHDP